MKKAFGWAVAGVAVTVAYRVTSIVLDIVTDIAASTIAAMRDKKVA